MDGAKLAAMVIGFAREPKAARAKVAAAMEFVRDRQKETMAAVREALG